MRSLILSLCLLILVNGCHRSGLSVPPGLEHDPVWTGKDGNVSDDAGGAVSDAPTVIPVINAPIGRVASVHTTLRFVILDFPFHPMPQVERRLFIYRKQQKVGVVKVTGPSHGRTIAADIIEGEANPGDQVRPD